MLNLNLKGVFFLTQKLIPLLSAAATDDDWGRVINLSSVGSRIAPLGASPAYGASKAGVEQLTRIMARELGRFRITCNAICPGNLLDSPLWTHPEKGLFVQYLRAGKVPGAKTVEEVRQAYMNQVPMKRGCSYEDIGNAVVFLASDQSTYITGIALSVTGGQEMN